MEKASWCDSGQLMSGGFQQRKLARMVEEGSKEEVMAYLASADRTKDDWQRELDESVVVAVSNKKPEILRYLVEAGAELHRVDQSTHKLLIYSVFRMDDPAIVNIFFEYYEEKNRVCISCPVCVNLLLAALESKTPELVTRAWSMVQTMKNPIVTNASHPIHFLISNSGTGNHTCLTDAVLGFLLDKGYDINGTDDGGYTSLLCATQVGCLACVRTLMKHGADSCLKNACGVYACELACQHGYFDIMEELLQEVSVAEHPEIFESLLHEACDRGWMAAVSYLLERGVNLNCTNNNDRTPLSIAVDKWEIDLIICLFQRMLSEGKCDSKATMIRAMRFLLSQGYGLNDDEDILGNRNQQIERIIKGYAHAGFNLNLEDDSGHTYLMDIQTDHGTTDLSELLIHYGADVNAVARDGKSALWEAIVYELHFSVLSKKDFCSSGKLKPSVSMLRNMLSHNIDIGISRHQHEDLTPLQLAFLVNEDELCNLLLDADCSLFKMTEFLSSTDESRLNKEMREVRTRILEMCELQPYSLKAQARLAVLRAIGQGNLKEKLHSILRCKLLPKQLVNYLGKAIRFNADVEDVE